MPRTRPTPEETGVDPAVSHRSSPSGNRYLAQVLRTQLIRPEHSVIDIGCGKGSAMRVLLGFPFGRVDVVELSSKVSAIAQRNFERLGILNLRCKIFCCDATALTKELDEYSHFYMYNPFFEAPMAIVVENLHQSLERRPRPAWLLYNTPHCHAFIEGSSGIRRAAREPSRPLNVYQPILLRAMQNDSAACSRYKVLNTIIHIRHKT